MLETLLNPFKNLKSAGFSVGLLALTVMVLFEVPVMVAVLILFFAVLHTTLGGQLLQICTRQPATPTEFIGFGFAIGSLVALCIDQIFVLTPLRDWSWSLLVGTVLIFFNLHQRKPRYVPRTSYTDQKSLTVFSLFFLILAILVQERYWPIIPALGFLPLAIWSHIRQNKGLATYSMSWLLPVFGSVTAITATTFAILNRPPLWWIKTQDFQFFESLSFSLANFGSRDQVYAVGFPVEYHWFSYGWVGMMTRLVNAGEWVVLTRAGPVLIVIAILLMVIAILSSVRLTGIAVAIATVIFILLNDFNFESFSMIHSYVWLISSIWLSVGFLSRPSLLHYTIAPLLAAGAYGAKSSNLAVLISIIVIVVLIAFYEGTIQQVAIVGMFVSYLAALGTIHWFLYAKSSYPTTVQIGTIGIARNLFGDLRDLSPQKLTLASGIVLLNLVLLPLLAISINVLNKSISSKSLLVVTTGSAIGGVTPLLFIWSEDYELEEYFLHAMSIITTLTVAAIIARYLTSQSATSRSRNKLLAVVASFGVAVLWSFVPITKKGGEMAIFTRVIAWSTVLIAFSLLSLWSLLQKFYSKKPLQVLGMPMILILCVVNAVSLNERWIRDYQNFEREVTFVNHKSTMLGRDEVIDGALLVRANTQMDDIIASNYFCEKPLCALADYAPNRINWKRGGEALTLSVYSERRFWVTGYGFLWQNTEPPLAIRRRIGDSLTTLPPDSGVKFFLRDKSMPCQCEPSWQLIGETSRFELFRL